MIITRTPFRISFTGGGSDLQAFYSKHPGAVLSTSINQYMYISSHAFFEKDKLRLKYSRTETANSVDELEHPIFRTLLKKFNVNGGMEFSSIADVPAGTGMGSSSSFTVGVLHNLYANRGEEVSKERLAQEACDTEINILKEPIGKQDQYAAAYGGMNIFRFNADETVTTEPIHLVPEINESLESSLMMFYTGHIRSASEILKEQKKNMEEHDKFEMLKSMTLLTDDLKSTLLGGNLDDFGKILHENWILKQQLSGSVSNSFINEAYDAALNAGALGGKLLGAGGGGFLLFYCPLHLQEKVKLALHSLRLFDFKFENQGSKLIYDGNKQY